METKEIPKLPANKAIKGKIFDDWQATFLVKMSQAKVDDIMEDSYVKPRQGDAGYDEFKMKAIFSRIIC